MASQLSADTNEQHGQQQDHWQREGEGENDFGATSTEESLVVVGSRGEEQVFPQEVVSLILSFLSISEQSICSGICRNWREIVDNSSFSETDEMISSHLMSPTTAVHSKARNHKVNAKQHLLQIFYEIRPLYKMYKPKISNQNTGTTCYELMNYIQTLHKIWNQNYSSVEGVQISTYSTLQQPTNSQSKTSNSSSTNLAASGNSDSSMKKELLGCTVSSLILNYLLPSIYLLSSQEFEDLFLALPPKSSVEKPVEKDPKMNSYSHYLNPVRFVEQFFDTYQAYLTSKQFLSFLLLHLTTLKQREKMSFSSETKKLNTNIRLKEEKPTMTSSSSSTSSTSTSSTSTSSTTSSSTSSSSSSSSTTTTSSSSSSTYTSTPSLPVLKLREEIISTCKCLELWLRFHLYEEFVFPSSQIGSDSKNCNDGKGKGKNNTNEMEGEDMNENTKVTQTTTTASRKSKQSELSSPTFNNIDIDSVEDINEDLNVLLKCLLQYIDYELLGYPKYDENIENGTSIFETNYEQVSTSKETNSEDIGLKDNENSTLDNFSKAKNTCTSHVYLYLFGIQLKHKWSQMIKKFTAYHQKMNHFEVDQELNEMYVSIAFEKLNNGTIILDLDEENEQLIRHLAEQFTLRDYEHFIHRLKMHELIGKPWRTKDKESLKRRCPTIDKMLNEFDRVATWVSQEIVTPKDVSIRAKRIRFFIKLATDLLELYNYQTSFAVIAGLLSASTYRLKQTKALLTDEEKDRYENQFREMVSLRNDFQILRTHLTSREQMPCIPYFGMFMADLKYYYDLQTHPTFAKLFHHTRTEDNEKYVYWYVVSREYDIVQKIKHWQRDYHEMVMKSLKKVQHLQDVINFVLRPQNLMSPNDLYNISVSREKRQ